MRNPYISGGSISTDKCFYNRHDLISELLNADSKAHYLKGNRRIGKTSLLKRIEREINYNDGKQFAVFCDLGGSNLEKDFAAYLIRAISKARGRKGIEMPQFKSENLLQIIKDLVNWAESTGYSCFLLLDEAEAFLKLPNETRGALRNVLINFSDNLTVLLAATKHLQKLYKDKNGEVPFLADFLSHHIGCFDDTAAEALIRQVGLPSNSQPKVDSSLIKDIIHYCGNHPFYIQWLCKELFENGSLRPLKDTDLLLSSELSNLIEMDFQYLSEEEQNTLLEFKWGRAVAITDLPSDRRMHLRDLQCFGFLKTDGDKFSISNIFLHQWLENHRNK